MHDELPPGPREHPIRQALAFGRDPYAFLRRAADEHGPVFTLRLPGDPPRIVVSEPEHIRRIFAMKADEILASAAGIPVNLGERTLLFLDGDPHRRDRKLMMPPLHGEQLESYATTMHDATVAALDRLEPGTKVDVHALLQSITLDVILRCVFGLRDQAQIDRVGRPVVEWLEGTFVPAAFFLGMVVGWARVRGFLDRSAANALAERPVGLAARLPWNRVGNAKAEVIAYLVADLERCRREGTRGRTDILAALADARDEDGEPMATEHAVDELITMLVGGHETTANTLAWTLSHVLARPDIEQRIRDEIEARFAGGAIEPARCRELEYLGACLDESMRITPIAPAVPRVLARSYPLGRWTLPAGAILFPCTYVTHHRADLWPEPDVFRPERFLGSEKIANDRFFPFGGGRRVCIGMAFARFEMRIVMATMLARAELRLVDPRPRRPIIRGLTVAPHELVAVYRPRGTGQRARRRTFSADGPTVNE